MEGRNNANILVLDRKELVRYTISQILTGGGFSVHESHSKQSASDIIAQCDIDIVIYDMGIPKKLGLDVLSDVRRIQPAVKVILIVEQRDLVARTHLTDISEINPSFLLVKPFSIESLSACIENCLVS